MKSYESIKISETVLIVTNEQCWLVCKDNTTTLYEDIVGWRFGFNKRKIKFASSEGLHWIFCFLLYMSGFPLLHNEIRSIHILVE